MRAQMAYSRMRGRAMFFSLVRAGELTDCMLYTNVAIAIPRSPMHFAYQSWDLQDYQTVDLL
ncbi:MAG: hypothetical protein Ct9H90mP5_01330 [Acidimicrobiaceae bacterium]|nr:MAG: hypothetical protein Ct9H90mP5_01330 [Acidimicrobiaceae bacterium]